MLCHVCKRDLPDDNFSPRKGTSRGRKSQCRECRNALWREDYKLRPEKYRRPSRAKPKPTTKTCRMCSRILPLSAFYNQKRVCAVCCRVRRKAYRVFDPERTKLQEKRQRAKRWQDPMYVEANKIRCRKRNARIMKEKPEEEKRRKRDSMLRSHYGITLEQYEQMFSAQKGVCAICERGTSYCLAVDHDHVTGKVRQLLCKTCNAGLGSFHDDRYLLSRAIEYLSKQPSSTKPVPSGKV